MEPVSGEVRSVNYRWAGLGPEPSVEVTLDDISDVLTFHPGQMVVITITSDLSDEDEEECEESTTA